MVFPPSVDEILDDIERNPWGHCLICGQPYRATEWNREWSGDEQIDVPAGFECGCDQKPVTVVLKIENEFDKELSMKIDEAVKGKEETHGLKRLMWRIKFWWLTRSILK